MARAELRKANEFRVEMKAQPGQAHRSAAGSLIDYRLQEVTDSAVRAISTVPGNFEDKPKFGSPWHHHDCDMQIALILDGSVELGYRADEYARADKGDILFIPGHTMHDVGAPSADYQIAEITFPGTFGTIEAPMPAKGSPTPAITLGSRDAVKLETTNGITTYRYPVAAPYDARYAMYRYRRSRTEPFVAAAIPAHQDRYRMMIAHEGYLVIDVGNGAQRFERGDLLVIPPDTEVRMTEASADFTAFETRLLRDA